MARVMYTYIIYTDAMQTKTHGLGGAPVHVRDVDVTIEGVTTILSFDLK